ncbi:sugar ABC transporter permease (plasmid) [Microvirga ossetica]|uniref:sn-glycerol-3-phosphate transport system permease protein UgpE n=1 Tax=Microvirga ossetica TaxID=1882682 RepID=A0A1B2EYY7_9HYPH|nr:carbohydrate ABC transporter permease [Microvirga ossetica]ANY85204.1 sugar ABC transporter permease [Microvirga ossetica]
MTTRAWNPARAVRLAILSVGALVFLAPYVWMISTAMKPREEIFSSSLTLIPERWAIVENFSKAFTRVPMLQLLTNGVIVCTIILMVQVLVALPCAYALAKLRFPGSRAMVAGIMLGLLVPIHATALPIYVALSGAGVLNTYFALAAPFTISVFAIFLFLQFFRAMPDDLLNAARLDGMSELAIELRIVVPNAWPAITAFSIFSVVAHWNDLFWPQIVVTETAMAPPPLGLIFFRAAEAGDDYGALTAATVVVTVPLLAAFLFAQRRFIEGITLTGLKG